MTHTAGGVDSSDILFYQPLRLASTTLNRSTDELPRDSTRLDQLDRVVATTSSYRLCFVATARISLRSTGAFMTSQFDITTKYNFNHLQSLYISVTIYS